MAIRMGYRPNPLATGLGQQRRHAYKHPISAEIAWINYWVNPKELYSYHEFDLYWKGAYQAAEQCGYRLEEFRCHNRLSPFQLEKVLLARNILGILIPPHRAPYIPSDWDEVDWGQFSVVRFGYSVAHPPADVVTGNQWNSGLLAFESIRQRGYQRIGFVTGLAKANCFKAGFLTKQMEGAAKHRVPALILPTLKDYSMDSAPLVPWLKKYRPDAILTDVAGLKKMLVKAGCRIPQDIGLATTSVLDGNADAGIYQNSKDMGRAAVELLISHINHNYRGIPEICRELLIEGKWVNGLTLPKKAHPARF